jgi:hypothetical protein
MIAPPNLPTMPRPAVSEPNPPTDPKTTDKGWSRTAILQAVQTPLGFFVLVVLVFEAVIGVFAAFSDAAERARLIGYMVLLLLLLIAVVALLAYFRPEALRGDRPPAVEKDVVTQLQRIEETLIHLDNVARYGSSGILVAALLGLDDTAGPHYLAGGRTIRPILLENLPETANSFYEMFRGRRTQLRLVEHHVVDNFLRNLIKTLPVGSHWLGITRLESREAWLPESAHPATFEFHTVAEQRTERRELSYIRLWGLQSDKQFQNMEEVMRGQQESGLHTRYLIGQDLDDISLIWIPRKEAKRAADYKDLDNPIDEVNERSELRPLCGIRFGAPRAGQELEEMTIYTPETDDFKSLERYFQSKWKAAQSLSPRPKRADARARAERD